MWDFGTLSRFFAGMAYRDRNRVASLLGSSRCVVLMPGGIVRPQELSVCGQQAVADMGAYMQPAGYFIACSNFVICLPGPYRVPAFMAGMAGASPQNTMPVLQVTKQLR